MTGWKPTWEVVKLILLWLPVRPTASLLRFLFPKVFFYSLSSQATSPAKTPTPIVPPPRPHGHSRVAACVWDFLSMLPRCGRRWFPTAAASTGRVTPRLSTHHHHVNSSSSSSSLMPLYLISSSLISVSTVFFSLSVLSLSLSRSRSCSLCRSVSAAAPPHPQVMGFTSVLLRDFPCAYGGGGRRRRRHLRRRNPLRLCAPTVTTIRADGAPPPPPPHPCCRPPTHTHTPLRISFPQPE